MVTIQPLWSPALIPVTSTLFYGPAVSRTQIDQITISNPDASAAYGVTVWWVLNGGSASAANPILPLRQLQPYEVFVLWGLVGQTLAVGDSIYAQATTANKLMFFGSGRLMTP